MLMHFYPHMTIDRVVEYMRERPKTYAFMVAGMAEYFRKVNKK